MKPIIATATCSDPRAHELETFTPIEADFYVEISLYIQVVPYDGIEERFRISVCSSEWVRKARKPILGLHMLVVDEFDWPKIRDYLVRQLSTISGETWDDIGRLVGRIAEWEYENLNDKRVPN